MVPKFMLDGMPYDLSEITANTLTGDTHWDGNDSAEILIFKLDRLNKEAIQLGFHPNKEGYWISFLEIMDSNGDWFTPTIQYAFHVFLSPLLVGALGDLDYPKKELKIYDLLKIKNIYVRNTQGDNKWKLVHRSQGFPIPEAERVRRGATGNYQSRLSESSHIWSSVSVEQKGVSYVVSNWIDISSFVFRELVDRDIDPEEGELKMLIQVAAMNKFQAAINKEAI